MTKLIEIREKLKDIYAKSGIYIRHILTFLLAFFSLFIVSRAVGSHSLIANPLVCVAIALVCAFFPINVTGDNRHCCYSCGISSIFQICA